MNAKQTNKKGDTKHESNLSLIAVEKTEHPSVWKRLKKAFSSSDITLEDWQHLEMKRTRSSLGYDQRRDF